LAYAGFVCDNSQSKKRDLSVMTSRIQAQVSHKLWIILAPRHWPRSRPGTRWAYSIAGRSRTHFTDPMEKPMAFDENLAARIRKSLARKKGIEEK
jgi:hypothetical protein